MDDDDDDDGDWCITATDTDAVIGSDRVCPVIRIAWTPAPRTLSSPLVGFVVFAVTACLFAWVRSKGKS
jgi:hypothetical protein